MTIRRRLSLAFSLIVALFAVTLLIYFWGNVRRDASVGAVRRAVFRQAQISAISQHLNDIQKQVTLLSQVATETAAGESAPGEALQFNRQLESVAEEIKQLRSLSDPDTQRTLNSFSDTFQKLSASWLVFHQNLGVDQAKAITELAVRVEPLAQDLLKTQLPQLQKNETARVDAASANFYSVARVTTRIAVIIFAISAFV